MMGVAPVPWSDSSPHAERFTSANGVRLQYLDWAGVGPALILIHGVTDNPHAFDDLAPAFTDRFHVLAYARRGHGDSEAKPPYDTATLTEDLRCFMDELGVNQAFLAGWSMGGNEITRMAGCYPERVCGIIYLDGAYDWADAAFQVAAKAMPASLQRTPSRAMESFDEYKAFQKAQVMTGVDDMRRVEAYLRAQVVCQTDGTLMSKMQDRESTLMHSLTNDAPRNYANVRCPALALYAQSLFDLNAMDTQRRHDAQEWEHKYMIPFRAKSVDRIRRELAGVKVVRISGAHADFFITCRTHVVSEMRAFLAHILGRS